jgi:hypothetical protein
MLSGAELKDKLCISQHRTVLKIGLNTIEISLIVSMFEEKVGEGMELDSCIINVNAILAKCTIGNLTYAENGIKTENKIVFNMKRETIPYAIKALGKPVTISIDDNNFITTIKAKERVFYKYSEESVLFIGFVLTKIDVIHNTIDLAIENSKEVFVKLFAPPRVQQNALPFIGQKVNFVLSTKDPKFRDKNKQVISVNGYQELGKSTQ